MAPLFLNRLNRPTQHALLFAATASLRVPGPRCARDSSDDNCDDAVPLGRRRPGLEPHDRRRRTQGRRPPRQDRNRHPMRDASEARRGAEVAVARRQQRGVQPRQRRGAKL